MGTIATAGLDPFGALLAGTALVRACALDETRQLVLATTRGLRELAGLGDDPSPFPFADLVADGDRTIALEALERQRTGTRVHARRPGGAASLVELRFEGQLVVLEDLTDRLAAEDRLRQLALHDPLTGLPNRTLLQDRMQQALLEARRHRTLLGVMVLDLNRFKAINDEFGHRVGDEVLRAAARRFTNAARESDTVARIGGDEFVIAAHLGRREDAALLAGRVVQSLTVPVDVAGQQHRVGVSVGIAVSPDDGETIDELFLRADEAMYVAKHAGSHVAFSERSRQEMLSLAPVPWREGLSVGVPEIDHQHRGLIESLNRVMIAVSSRAGAEVIVSRLDDLIGEARQHFESEEGLMRQAGLRSLDAHAAEHRSLLGDLRVLRNNHDFGDDVAMALQHLDRWLIDHIETFDRAAGRALLAAGTVGASGP